MSFMYYSVFGTFVTLLVGLIASWLVKGTVENQYSLKLLHPVVRTFIKTSNSYASNDILNNSAPQIKRESTVFSISDFEAVPKELTNTIEPKYTRNVVT